MRPMISGSAGGSTTAADARGAAGRARGLGRSSTATLATGSGAALGDAETALGDAETALGDASCSAEAARAATGFAGAEGRHSATPIPKATTTAKVDSSHSLALSA